MRERESENARERESERARERESEQPDLATVYVFALAHVTCVGTPDLPGQQRLWVSDTDAYTENKFEKAVTALCNGVRVFSDTRTSREHADAPLSMDAPQGPYAGQQGMHKRKPARMHTHAPS